MARFEKRGNLIGVGIYLWVMNILISNGFKIKFEAFSENGHPGVKLWTLERNVYRKQTFDKLHCNIYTLMCEVTPFLKSCLESNTHPRPMASSAYSLCMKQCWVLSYLHELIKWLGCKGVTSEQRARCGWRNEKVNSVKDSYKHILIVINWVPRNYGSKLTDPKGKARGRGLFTLS